MGRFARKITDEQKRAAVAEVLERRRTRHDVANNGIPGILPPGFVTPATVGQYVRQHQDNLRRHQPDGMRQALEETVWNLLEDLRAAQQRYRTRNGKKTPEELRQLAAAARQLQQIVETACPPKPKAPTQPTEEPDPPAETQATLADKLATGGDEGQDASNGSGGVRSEARVGQRSAESTELLNRAAPRPSR